MPTTTLLSIGPILSIAQNVVYALPAVKVTLSTTAPTPTIEYSNSSTMIPAIPVTLTTSGTSEAISGFIRCTSGNIDITIKRA